MQYGKLVILFQNMEVTVSFHRLEKENPKPKNP
jgi:hypothetical protein